jgi:ring-1,2-phenylacetyl-CoA epoxidase subunit PaaB
MKSLDPRVNRLPIPGQQGVVAPKAPLDQFGTFEVFVQPRQGKPFQHEGAVHAPDLEMAFVLAKETFTRRFTCVSLCVMDTCNVFVSALTEGSENAYDLLPNEVPADGTLEPYEIYHLIRRGKQHIHAGQVEATSPQHAMLKAREHYPEKVLNIWAVRTADIRFTTSDEQDFWQTLPEKKFRDASEYKGGEKLKAVQEAVSSKSYNQKSEA